MLRHIRLQKRATKFSEAAMWIKARYPDASAELRRELCIGRLQVFCLSFAVALESCTEQARQAYKMTFERYKDGCERAAMDSSRGGEAPTGRKLGCRVDWLTEIAQGIAVSYSCRFPSCRWYGMNHSWIADLWESHYRCPLCFLEYQPWTEKRGQLPYQKAIHIASPDGIVSTFPTKWPGSHEDKFLLECAEVHAANIQTDQDLADFASESVWQLEELVKRIKVCDGMVAFTWNAEKEYMLDPHKWPADGPLGWKRLRDGFHGNIIPDAPRGDWDSYVFVEWGELVAALGACIYVGKKFVE